LHLTIFVKFSDILERQPCM